MKGEITHPEWATKHSKAGTELEAFTVSIIFSQVSRNMIQSQKN